MGNPINAHPRKLLRGAVLIAIAMVSVLVAMPAAEAGGHAPLHVGIRCQADYEGDWHYNLDAYPSCTGFINEIALTDYVDFYFNLRGGAAGFTNGNGAEVCNSCGGVDSVDFFFVMTYGGVAFDQTNDRTYAQLAMWDRYTNSLSHEWRFGDSGKNAQVFAAYAPDIMKTSDGLFWDRWGRAMSGGVKIVLGGHDMLYQYNRTGAVANFAYRLQVDEPIGAAWLEALWYADNYNHPSEANTGVDANDCWNRAGATMQTVQTMPALRDSQIGYVCWVGWNGD
jgi:hypothetical protein